MKKNLFYLINYTVEKEGNDFLFFSAKKNNNNSLKNVDNISNTESKDLILLNF